MKSKVRHSWPAASGRRTIWPWTGLSIPPLTRALAAEASRLDHCCPSAARIKSRPSVSAAGPGCRISADLISMMRP